MIGFIFAVLLIVFAWRMGDRFDKRRQKPLELGHYIYPGVWVIDRVLPDAGPSAQDEKHPLQRLEEVGEGI